MIGEMLILSAGLGLFILRGIAGRWRVDHDEEVRESARPQEDRARQSKGE